MANRLSTKTIPAPVLGINARDSLLAMDEKDAIELENWWPGTTDLQIRKGSQLYISGLVGDVETLAVYSPPGGADKLFAFTSSGYLYDVSGYGTATLILTGLSSGKWQVGMISNAGGAFLVACNGADFMLTYDGIKWISVAVAGSYAAISSLVGNGTIATVVTAAPHGLYTGNTITVTGASVAGFNVTGVVITRVNATTFTYQCTATSSATGASFSCGEVLSTVNPKQVSSITLFKNRLWLGLVNSLDVYYLDLYAIRGTTTKFPLGAIAGNGGAVVASATWTVDSGMGVDDNIVFFTSQDQVIVYSGTDPANASTFALKGVYSFATPIGAANCCIKYMGDIYALTDYGITPLSSAILTAQITTKADVTDRILPLIQREIATSRGLYGWQIFVFPIANMLIVNIPHGLGNFQYCMNTLTGAWTKFTGWHANCFATFSGGLFFGAGSSIYTAWVGFVDGEAPIIAKSLQAFSDFGSQVQQKLWHMAQPVFYSTGLPTVNAELNVDYDTTFAVSGVLDFFKNWEGMYWGSMVWGSMIWGGNLVRLDEWQTVEGVGYSAALAMATSNNSNETHWSAVNYLFETGGLI